MQPNLVKIYQTTTAAHAEIYSQLLPIEKELPAIRDMKELADTALALSKSAQYLDTLRKEVERAQKKAERLACLLYLESAVASGPIKTPYVTASVDSKECFSIPKKASEPEKWKAMMEFVGMNEEFINGPNELARVHWPGLMQQISDLQEQGRPLPECFAGENKFVEYKLKLITTGKKVIGT